MACETSPPAELVVEATPQFDFFNRMAKLPAIQYAIQCALYTYEKAKVKRIKVQEIC